MPRLAGQQEQISAWRRGGRRPALRAWIGVALFAAPPGLGFAAGLEGDASLGLGYSVSELNWNIAGSLAGTAPNILSELEWKDLNVAMLHAAGELSVDKQLLLRGRAAYGEVISGDNQDSDYNGDDRSLEFSRSNNRGDGQVIEASLGVGYQFWWYDNTAGRYARIIPMFGYAWRGQYLSISEGQQVIPASEAGPIANLNSSYDARWQGPWMGLSLLMDTSERTRVTLDVEYHFADYRAEANWNLRTDLDHPLSFLHETRGTGVVAALSVRHDLSANWALTARVESQRFEGDPGLDTINLIDAASGALDPAVTRLNAVEWQSLGGMLALTRRF